MQTSTRRSARLLAAALCAGLLLLVMPAAPGAAPARRFFAPAESPAPAAKVKNPNSRLRRLGKKPGIRHLLHPIGTVRAAASRVKVGAARAIQNLHIARLEKKIKASAASDAEPTLDEVRHHSARVQRWRNTKVHHDEAHALLADRVAVMSHHSLETKLPKSELLESASALFDVVARGVVRIPVRQRFALDEVGEAHRAMESRATIGSSVLIP